MGSSVRPDTGAPALPSLHRLLTPEEFHAAQLMSPEALAQPGIFPLLPPIPKEQAPSPAPPPPERILDRLSQMQKDFAAYGVRKVHDVAAALSYPFQHPGAFLAGLVTSPAQSGLNAVVAPGVGEPRPDARLSKGGNSAQAGSLAPMAPLGTYDAEHGAVTEKERALAAGQVMAMELAPSLGPMLGGALVGASYSPDDLVTGSIAGALFGKGLDVGVKGAKAAIGATRGTPGAAGAPATEPAVRGMERTADESALANQARTERQAGRDAVIRDREASRAAARQDLAASRQAVRSHVAEVASAWKQAFTPDPQASAAKGIIRATTGAMAAQYEQAAFKLDEFRRVLDPLPDESKLHFIDAIETGTTGALDPEFHPVATALRQTLDQARDEIRGLGTGKLEHFIEDYFPHIWEDPDKATDVFRTIGGKGPLEGPGSFLKERTIPTTAEGIAQGLKPVTTNPIDLTLLKLREMQRYLMAHHSLNELKDAGLVKFVGAGGEIPDGYQRINDKIATVFGPRQGAVQLPEGASIVEGGNVGRVARGNERGALNKMSDLAESYYGKDTELRDAFTQGFKDGDTRGSLGDPKQGTKNPYREGTPHWTAWEQGFKEAYDPTQVGSGLPQGAKLTPQGEIGVEGGTVRPMTPEDVSVPGRRIMGEFWAPEPVAGIVNNYLSPGMAQTLKSWFPGGTGRALALTFDAYRGVGNTLNQAQLGLSAFHLGFTSMDATVSRTSLGVEYLAGGKPITGLKKIASAPMAALPGIIQGLVLDPANYLAERATGKNPDLQFGIGAKIRQAYLNPAKASPEFQALANAVKEAGGRVRQDSFYENSAAQKMIEAYKAGRPIKGTALLFPTFFEMAAKPIMEHIVPLQKLQVFGELAQKALSEMPPDATLAERRGALQDAWDSTDNRMGQLVYDNLFWNRTFKDLAMASTRSVGWNLGTIRELGGGVKDLAGAAADVATGHASDAELTHRAAYVVALPITIGLYGALYQYLRTGEGPQEAKDYFFPRTGQLDADGNAERVQLPSYMKDMFAYAGSPIQTLTHKVSPLPSALGEMFKNQDFYGDEIRNETDPLVTQVKQESEFVLKQLVPFSLTNRAEMQKRGDESAATTLGTMFGITPAPRGKVRSDAQNLMADYAKQNRSVGATPEQVEGRQARAEILAGLRSGNSEDVSKAINAAVESGNLTPPQLARIMKRAGLLPMQERFKGLTLDQAMNVFEKADEREQALFAEILAKKIRRAR